jgi:S-DNA-T family DNA segregation ATPase FtsK/SpoIIIE
MDRNARIIEQTLASFGIDAKVVESYIGPSVVQFALDIPLGVKVAKVASSGENLALALGVDANAVRIESIPGTTYLGIEVPRSKREPVTIRELMESPEMQSGKGLLPITVGKDIDGKAVIADIQKMPHVLIAGATGSGKSILTNSFIVSLLMRKTPDEVKLILVDPKQVELSDYNGIPHLLTPVITDMEKVVNALKWAVTEMERRYTILANVQVRNIEGYNQKLGFAAMPYIVIVIDEMADMMMTANRVDAETAIVRLAQKARAVGIHLILATQRPSVNVITGLIKANIPARIGMSVTSSVDSRVILDSIGAESLMGRGDLLYKAPDKNKSARLQGSMVSQEEVIRVVNFIKSQVPEVQYATSILEPMAAPNTGEGGEVDVSGDNMFEQAVRVVVNYQKGSSSFLQRKLNIGFNRAARLLEEMEEMGIVGPSVGGKPREVLISDADEFLSKLANKPQG